MENNLTTGSVFKSVVSFSLPYFLSYFLQTLYGMADLYIISRFNKTDSICAVSIGSQVMHMVTVMIVGLAMGATVTIARSVGAGNSKKASKAVGNSATMLLLSSVIIAALLILLLNPIVKIMSTPEQAVEQTAQYLLVCFIGIPFITAYNLISSVFRGLGDSKSPMYFVAIACVCNIAFDFLFIGKFKLAAVGAALGTTLSQAVSVVLSLVYAKKKQSVIKPSKADFKPEKKLCGQILKIGVPVSLQDGFIQIAFLIITVIANKRALNDSTAVGIVEKFIGFVFLVPSSMLSSVSALASQNLGAKRPDRAKLALRHAILICLVFGAAVGLGVQFCAPNIMRIFEKNPDVISLGTGYLKAYIWDCFFAGIHFCLSGYFCALQKPGISFLHNSLSILLVRVPGAYLASRFYPSTLFPMGLAAPLGSLFSCIICIAAYLILNKKERLEQDNE